MSIEEYSSSLHQSKRIEIVNRFKRGKIDMIVCSDVMARGLDIDDIETVINYDTPSNIKNYVHRYIAYH